MEINLIVVRSPDPQLLAKFYSNFGIDFTFHKHGNSPYHFSSKIGSVVFEIYPLSKSQDKADETLRLGFALDKFDTVIQKLSLDNVTFVKAATSTEYGYMAVVRDPDGRQVEIYKA